MRELMPVIKNKPDINDLSVSGDGTVTLTWDNAIGADKYIIQRSVRSDMGWKKVVELANDIHVYQDSTLPGEGVYWYRIIAQKMNGDAVPIKKICIPRSVNYTSVEPPVLLDARTEDNSTVILSWKESPEADGYIILRRFTFMKAPVRIGKAEKGTLSFVDENPVKGQLYFYSIQTLIEDKENLRYSDPGNEISCVCMDPPAVLKQKKSLSGKVSFFLRLTAGADGYVMFRSDSPDGEYREAARAEGIDSLTFETRRENREKSAYFRFACYKTFEGKEFIGPMGPAAEIKF